MHGNWATCTKPSQYIWRIDDNIIDRCDCQGLCSVFNEAVNSIRGPIQCHRWYVAPQLKLETTDPAPRRGPTKAAEGTADTIFKRRMGLTTITDQRLTHVNKLYGEASRLDSGINGTRDHL